MDEYGLIYFLSCKIGLMFAAMSLLGVALATYSFSLRAAERGELYEIANAVGQSISMVDSLPGKVKIARKLPAPSGPFKISLSGEQRGRVQLVRVLVTAEEKVERVFLASREINGGSFELTYGNPSSIRIEKDGDAIRLELV